MQLSKVLFSFQGRIPRSTYWYYTLLYGIVVGLVELIYYGAMQGTGPNSGAGTASTVFLCLGEVLVLAGLVPAIAVSVKRAHDRDHSGWYVLIGLVPAFGVLLLLIQLGFLRGTVGENKYGPDPLTAAAT